MTLSCPACGHEFPQSRQQAGRRICADCGKGVGRHHKWKTGSDGLVHHRDCQNPTRKIKTEEAAVLFT